LICIIAKYWPNRVPNCAAGDSFKKSLSNLPFYGRSQVCSKENKTDEKTKAEFICSGMGNNQNKKNSTNKSKEKAVAKNRREGWIICHRKQLNAFIQ